MKWNVLVRNLTFGLAILIVFSAMNSYGQLPQPRYYSIESYEDMLKMQETLIESFESLLKNTTFDETKDYQSSKFLDSFDDLADRQQKGIYSFEDLVSFNWSGLDTDQKINLTNSFEDLLHSEFSILSSNEDLLKREFCKLNVTAKQEFLNRFEDRIKYEKLLLSKFEAWLNYEQTLELMGATENAAWFKFLDSFEELIREQAKLLSSFEDLAKFDCSAGYLVLMKEVNPTSDLLNPYPAGTPITYNYIIKNAQPTDPPGYIIQNITITDNLFGTVIKDLTLIPQQSIGVPIDIPQGLHCVDYVNLTCKVCNWGWACGEVVTPNGNFTICVNSKQICTIVDDTTGSNPHPGISSKNNN
jgi:hypothetical protein